MRNRNSVRKTNNFLIYTTLKVLILKRYIRIVNKYIFTKRINEYEKNWRNEF